MIKSLEEISQILIVAEISSSHEVQILIVAKKLFNFPEAIEEQQLHESHPHEDLYSCKLVEETKESWTTFDGKQELEPEIEAFLTCLSTNPLSTQEDSHLIIENFH